VLKIGKQGGFSDLFPRVACFDAKKNICCKKCAKDL